MTARDDFNGLVSDWLDEQAGRGAPDYLDEILARTTRTRQRPAWSSLERFLPMQTTLRFAPVPRFAWLLVVLGLVIALAAAALLAVGSRPRLPAPFGTAGNGLIVYGASGDLFAVEPVSGATRPLVTGLTNDETPWFSRDGTKFVFAREAETDGLWQLVVANADGSNARPITEPIYPTSNEWSPEGDRLSVVDTSPTTPTLAIHTLDGTPPTVLDIDGMLAEFVQWRPGGQQLVFRGTTANAYGLYMVDLGSKELRQIGESGTLDDLRDPRLSPDGTKVVYTKWVVDHPTLRIVDVDAGGDREIVFDGPAGSSGWVQDWSPDNTKLLFTRLADGPSHVAVSAQGGGPAVEIGPGWTSGEVAAAFSPDGTWVMARYEFDDSTWLLDVTGQRPDKRLPASPSLGSWQRTAP
jgi:Tol biopolymer transport system component